MLKEETRNCAELSEKMLNEMCLDGYSCKIRNRVTLIRNLYTVDFVVTAYFCIVNVEY